MAEQTKKSVPDIRFKGFSEEWEEKTLGELLLFKNGYNAGRDQYGTGKKFINVLDIIENDFITYDRIIGKVSISPKDFEKYEVKFGDILFQRSSETREEVGQANVYLDQTKTATFGGFVIRGRPLIEFDSVFFNDVQKTAKARKEISSRSCGSTRYNIGQDSLEVALVNIAPELAEQRKIANFLTTVVGIIDLHQRKHEKLVTLKKAMLQKMFPQNGATAPEIRFKGFSDPWEEKKLVEIGNATSGTSIESEFNNNGQFKVISIGSYSENSTYTDQGIRADLSEKTKKRILCKNDLTMVLNDKTASGRIIGRVLLIERDNSFVYNQRTQRIEPFYESYDPQFLYQLFNAPLIRRKVIDQSQGNTQIYVNWSTIKDLAYVIPQINEQQKIGTFFRQMDELIAQHGTQVKKLKQIKAACLEKMFV